MLISNRMICLYFICSAILLFNTEAAQAQTEVKKYPNEIVIFNWDFSPAEEQYITGFRLYSGSSMAGPFNTLIKEAGPSFRTTQSPATFSPGSTTVYYVVRPFKTEGLQTTEAGDSNVVEVDLAVHSVTNLQVR
jgi:hypothetical protein